MPSDIRVLFKSKS